MGRGGSRGSSRARRRAIEGFTVLALEIPHKGGRTFGFRVTDGSATIAYLSDHCPTALGPGPDGLGEYHEAALALARRCDLLVHDAQYLDEELERRASFGHASCGYAAAPGRARPGPAGRCSTTTTRPAPTTRSTPWWPPTPGARYRSVGAAEGMVVDLPLAPAP